GPTDARRYEARVARYAFRQVVVLRGASPDQGRRLEESARRRPWVARKRCAPCNQLGRFRRPTALLLDPSQRFQNLARVRTQSGRIQRGAQPLNCGGASAFGEKRARALQQQWRRFVRSARGSKALCARCPKVDQRIDCPGLLVMRLEPLRELDIQL